jgi:hypothetical protein
LSIVMFDSVSLDQIPADPQAVAAYLDGEFANAAEARARFPHAQILTIAVFASGDADCLDIETGDATPSQAVAWYERQKARGVARPCLYASASVMQSDVVPVLLAAKIPRSAVRLWSAHYEAGSHICGPASCHLTSIEMDGTQWTDVALGRDLDESLLAADFFGAAPEPVPWQEAMLRSLPVLRQGSTGTDVRTVQALCTARGHATALDSVFGPATATSVAAIQRSFGITVDSVVGQDTWTVLVTAAVP